MSRAGAQGRRAVLEAVVAGTLSVALLVSPAMVPLSGMQASGAEETAESASGESGGEGEEGETAGGGVTIVAGEANQGVSYDAYRVFTGGAVLREDEDRETGEDGDASDSNGEDASEGASEESSEGLEEAGDEADVWLEDLRWASDEAHEAVLAVIQEDAGEDGYEDSDDARASAQLAAVYIAERIGDAEGTASGNFPSRDSTVRPYAGTFAAKLASALSTTEADASLAAGERVSLEDGWYLFATDAETLSTGQAASSPIFAVVGEDDLTIEEKIDSAPVATKSVLEDSTGEWAGEGDFNRGQWYTYRAECTVADNCLSYETYAVNFHDSFEGGEIDASSVKIYVVNVDEDGEESAADVTDSFAVTVEDGSIQALCDDVLGLEGFSASSIIRMEYLACLGEEASLGAEGNANAFYAEYSNDPFSETLGTTDMSVCTSHTYALSIHKQDGEDGSSLAGAAFTLKVAGGNSDEESAGLYVQEDGSLDEEAHEFVSGEDGDVTVEGIDEGTYVLSETAVPDSDDGSVVYRAIDDATLTIGSNIAEVGSDATGGTALVLEASSDQESVTVAEADADGGRIELVVDDPRDELSPFSSVMGASTSGDGSSAPATGAACLMGLLVIAAFALFARKAASRKRESLASSAEAR